MTTKSKPTLLVTGASGQLGKRVVELLLDAKAGHVIATTRTPEKLAALAARGAEIRPADFKDPASLRAAFSGAERMLLISTGDLFPLGLRLGQHRAAVAAAVAAGVRHILYTSGPAPYPIAGGGLIDDHFWTEQAIFASPLEWTILRHQIYMDTLLMSVTQAAAVGPTALVDGQRRVELRHARGLRARRCGRARVRLQRPPHPRHHGSEARHARRSRRDRVGAHRPPDQARKPDSRRPTRRHGVGGLTAVPDRRTPALPDRRLPRLPRNHHARNCGLTGRRRRRCATSCQPTGPPSRRKVDAGGAERLRRKAGP